MNIQGISSDLFKDSAFNLLTRVVGLFFSYIVVIWITNNYGASEFGMYTFGITVLGIATLVPKIGLDQSLIRIMSELHANYKISDIVSSLWKVILLVLVLSILTGSLLYFYSKVIAQIFDNQSYEFILKIVSYTIFPIVLIKILSATMQGMGKIRLFSIISLILLPFIFFITLQVNDLAIKDVQLLEIYSISSYVAAIIGFLIVGKVLPLGSITKSRIYPIKRMIKISFPMMMAGSVMLIMTWTDILMLSYFSSDMNVGIFSAAQKVSFLAGMGLMVVNAHVAPKIAKFFVAGRHEELERLVHNASKLIISISFPILLLIFIFPEEIMEFFGKEFIVGSSVMMMLSIGQLINVLCGPVGSIMQMTNNQTIFKNVVSLALIVNILLNYILIPVYGIEGAAIASMTSMILWNIILLVIIRIKMGFFTLFITFSKH